MQEVLRLKKQSAKKHLEVQNGYIKASDQEHKYSPKLGSSPGIKVDQIKQLEKKVVLMTQEKDEKIAENTQRLKEEEQLIYQFDQEIRKMEQQLKERNQEQNLLDLRIKDALRPPVIARLPGGHRNSQVSQSVDITGRDRLQSKASNRTKHSIITARGKLP